MTTTAVRERPAPGPPGRSGRRRAVVGLLVFAGVAVAFVAYALPAYLPPTVRTARIPVSGPVHLGFLAAHVFTAAVAMVAAPLQLWPWLRARHPRVHRWSGRTYLFLGVFPSAVLVLPVIVLAPYGASLQAGTATLAVLWFVTAQRGYAAVRQRRFADHRRWMIRSVALTFAIVTNRLLIAPFVLVQLTEAHRYPGGAGGATFLHDTASGTFWLALVLHLIGAEWYLNRRRGSVRS